MNKHRYHIVLSGRVQGVAFRASAAHEAHGLHLTGWVKNLADRSVEIVVEGDDASLSRFEKWCLRGPSAARVDHMTKDVTDATGEFTEFSIRY
jgi:acylphosphatase